MIASFKRDQTLYRKLDSYEQRGPGSASMDMLNTSGTEAPDGAAV